MYEDLYLYEHKVITVIQEVWEGCSDSIIKCKLSVPTYFLQRLWNQA